MMRKAEHKSQLMVWLIGKCGTSLHYRAISGKMLTIREQKSHCLLGSSVNPHILKYRGRKKTKL